MDNNCRICLSEEGVMLSVFDKDSDFNMCLSELILDISDVKIDPADPYSKIICNECTNELFIAAKFKEKCKKSEEALFFINNMTEIENDDLEGILDETETEYDDELVNSDLPTFKQENEVDETNSTYEEVEFLDVEDSLGYIVVQAAENDYETDLEEEQEDEEMEPDNIDYYQLSDSEKKSKDQKFLKEPKLQSVINHCCEFCGAGFTFKQNLLKHMHQVHSLIELFSCETCDIVCDTNEELLQHSRIHENEIMDAISDEPQIETSTDDINNLIELIDVDKKKNHKCQTCNKGFICKSALVVHIRTHTGEKPFKCLVPDCGKSFTTVGGLDLHQKRHTGVKNFKCEFCDRCFVESSNLRVHRRIHTGEKPHTCTTCNRSFSRVFLLQIHQRTHSGEKPYICDFCDKSFAQNGDLSAHKRIHTGERPHSCTVCGKGFIKSSGLKQHMRKHLNKPPRKNKSFESSDLGSDLSKTVKEEYFVRLE